MSNNLNDIQAAAWMKDQKIKKISQEETNLKNRLGLDEEFLMANASSLKELQESSNVMKMNYKEARHVISTQNTTIHEME